jgi:hypothetical protein
VQKKPLLPLTRYPAQPQLVRLFVSP